MSGMVLTQLLNPDSGADRSVADRAADATGQGRAESGPSRYDEVVRQQEQRLEKQRARERAEQAAARQQDNAQGQAAANGPKEASTQAANERRSETARAEKTADAADPDDATGPDTRAANEKAESGVVAGQALTGELNGNDSPEGMAGLLGLAVNVPPAETPPALPRGEAARSAAQVMASLTGNGQTPNGLPTAGRLFADMLKSSENQGKPGAELVAGLQGNALQALADGGTGKSADTLTAQLATRLAAPESSLPQNQATALKGADPQALMRSYSTSVDVPVGAGEWGEKVMGKLAWLTASQMQVAEIHVTPPDMGPLEVRVQVQNDQAAVTVHATTPAVREQLELHGHRLRDMLSEHGLTLEGFDVSDSPGREASDQQGDGESGRGAEGALASADTLDESEALESGELDLSWKGELDLYA